MSTIHPFLRALFVSVMMWGFSTTIISAQVPQLYKSYLPVTTVTISLTVKGIDVQNYSEIDGVTEVKSRVITERFGNRQILELLAAANLLLGVDGQPTKDTTGWSIVAGVGFDQTPWPKLEGIGCYAINTKILKIADWNGSDLYAPGLSLFGGLNGTPAEPTLAQIQINGTAPLTAMKLRAEPGVETTLVTGGASFEGPVQIDVTLPDYQAPTDPSSVIKLQLQGHIKGGFDGFNWHPDPQKAEPMKNTLPMRRTTVTGISGVMENPPAEDSNVSVPSVITGSVVINPTRLRPYFYEP